MKVLPMADFTSLYLKFLGNLDYNDSTTGTWYHIINLPGGGVSFTPSFPLPNEEFSVNCSSKERGNLLSWYCDMHHIQSYTVEKSLDGLTFSEVAFFNANNQTNYSWTDKNNNYDCYYRIKIEDINGNVEYSKTCYLRTIYPTGSILLSPNPLQGNKLSVSFKNCPNKRYTLSVMDMVGRILMKEDVSVKSDEFHYSCEIITVTGPVLYVVVEDTDSNDKSVYKVLR